MDWRPAKSLIRLRDQVNEAWPNRSKVSDGTIGDPSHRAEGSGSDHNPNKHGVVCALDITHDPANGVDIDKLSDALAASRDTRIKYLIANSLILVPADYGWTWQPYTGSNPHTSHLHVSVYGDYDSTADWNIGKSKEEDMITREQYLEGAKSVGTEYGKDFNFDPNRTVDQFVQFLDSQAPRIQAWQEHELADKITGVKNVIGKDYNSPFVGQRVVTHYPKMVEFWLSQRQSKPEKGFKPINQTVYVKE